MHIEMLLLVHQMSAQLTHTTIIMNCIPYTSKLLNLENETVRDNFYIYLRMKRPKLV